MLRKKITPTQFHTQSSVLRSALVACTVGSWGQLLASFAIKCFEVVRMVSPTELRGVLNEMELQVEAT